MPAAFAGYRQFVPGPGHGPPRRIFRDPASTPRHTVILPLPRAAEYLHCSEQWLLRAIADGRAPDHVQLAPRLVGFHVGVLDRWLTARAAGR